VRNARLAWAFLTRLPGGIHPADGTELTGAVPWFPAVGVVIGLLLGGAYLGFESLVSPLVAALLVVGLGAVLTGGFHEDGLADTFDSFGGYTAERRLEIMRDSRIGTFGALALVVAVGLKVAALAPLSGIDGLGALVVAHGLGRASALVVMAAGPQARSDGFAATGGALPRLRLAGVVALTALVASATGPSTATAVVLVGASALGMIRLARHRFGGITGDVLGASEQIGEILALVVVGELVGGHGWLWA
jgi:adenosylcobinamide-GDP ribazoletransferase